jgi:hypothetical protein
MASPLDIDYRLVGELNALQLTDLLRRLLLFEVTHAGISPSAVEVSLKIEVADGGEDGRISWNEGPPSTEYVPKRLTQFQCKAKKLGPVAWKKELLTKSGSVKPRIDETLSRGGAYIGFTTQALNARQKDERTARIREAFAQAGATYAGSAVVRIYDANQIANWASTNLATVLFIRNAVGRPITYLVYTFERLVNSLYRTMRFAFVSTPELSNYVQVLRKELSTPGSVTRVVGLSGLGKTRLLLEVLGSETIKGDLSLALLQNRLLFLDASTAGHQEIKNILSMMVVEKVDALLVVDDCPIALHTQLQSQLIEATSIISLVTLDISGEKVSGTNYITLSPLPEHAIKEMLKQAYEDFSPSDIDRIATFAGGFPKMAEFLADAQLSREDNTALLDDDAILARMLWGRSQEDRETKEILMAVSLFDHFGAYDDLESELQWISDNIVHIDHTRVFRVVQDYAGKDILQRQGRYLHMIPEPLALRLAADWWKGTPRAEIERIVSMPMPQSLSMALTRRISRLDFLPKAKEFVADLCGPNGPFGRAEGILSKRGSVLFRSIAETNPVAAANALWRVLASMTPEDVRGIDEDGRRNLVWTLEKLLFLRETFKVSARVIFRLAAYETETWSNNATGVFRQLFSLYLAGTEVSYDERLKVVREIVSEEDPDALIVLPHALCKAYMTGSFTRTGGSERIGSSLPREDYRPKTYGEIFSYWENITEILIELKKKYRSLSDAVMTALSQAIFSLSTHKQYGIADTIVQTALTLEEPWIDGLESIDNLLSRDVEQVDQDTRLKLNEWRDQLLPKSAKGKMKYYISEAPWNRMSKQGQHYQDDSYHDAIALAKELAHEPEDVIANLDLVCLGEQRHSLTFAKELSDNSDFHERILEGCIEFMRNNATENLNPSFLSGLLLSLKEKHGDAYNEQVEKLMGNERLARFMVRLMIPLVPTSDQLRSLVNLVKAGKVDIKDFSLFAYGSATQSFSVEQLYEFLRSLSAIDESGTKIALDILFMYQFSKPESRSRIRPIIIELLTANNFMINKARQGWTDLYHVAELLKILEITGGLPIALIKKLTKKIAMKAGDIHVHRYFNEVLRILLKASLSEVWKVLAEILIGSDPLASYSLQMVLRNPFENGPDHIIEELPEELLWTWCAAHPDRGPEILVRILSPLASIEGKLQFNPFVLRILTEYSSHGAVFSALSSNLGTYSGWGSAIPHFSQLKEVLSPLTAHSDKNIREWAISYVSFLERQIAQEETLEGELDVPRY